jgi:hypothetical protein
MSGDITPPPIVVTQPTQAQIAAGVRQVAASLGVIAAAFGAAGVAAKANIVVSVAPEIATVLMVVGPLIWGGFVWLGQMATRRHAQDAAAMAAQLPDQVAKVR